MTILSGEARLICATLADAASTVIAMSLVAPGAAPARYSLAVDKDRISPRERYLLTARVTAVSEGQGAQARRFETTKAYPWSPAGEGPHRISVEPVE